MKRQMITVAAGLMAFAACQQQVSAPGDGAAAPPSPEPAVTQADASVSAIPLPIPINAVMVSLVDFAADGIWRPAASEQPLTERQWLMVEQDATNLVAAVTLITSTGSGVNDAGWVTESDWRRWSLEMQQVAMEAKEAATERDQERLRLVGDRLVEICQTCHQKYKPGLPSMGITRFPIYPKRDGG